jgi:hypothetical protein
MVLSFCNWKGMSSRRRCPLECSQGLCWAITGGEVLSNSMARYKHETFQAPVLDAIAAFYSGAEEMASEIRDVYESMPESLQGGDRGTTLDQTADTLESISEPSRPDAADDLLAGLQCTVGTQVLGGRQRGSESRAVRMGNIAAEAAAAVDAIRDWCDAQDDIEAADKPSEDTLRELRDWCDEIEGHKDEAENCEFPGMYG